MASSGGPRPNTNALAARAADDAALAETHSPGAPERRRPTGELEFEGTDRYRVQHRIGAGNMGIVYEALDRKVGERVALKLLGRRDARNLLRFKTEFRAIQSIDHTNLVRLLDLVENDGDWFYTMELIRGVDFLSWVRPSDLPELQTFQESPARADRCDEGRLRDALAQLAGALGALHEAGKIHRDVKPNNVLVRADGHLTLLDFGLITGVDDDERSSELHAVGTAAYMAPEQAAGGAVGPAADWYSVGVMMYEALTGRRPFGGNVLQILVDKQQKQPIHPRGLRPEMSRTLADLCMGLLAFDPAARPDLPQILGELGARVRRATSDPGASMSQGSPFVGRARELAMLAECHEHAVSRPVTVVVRGESGVGKTELVSRFVTGIDGVRASAPVVVLRGRCYERESVPYKALDGVVDSLSGYMSRLRKEDAAALLPRRAGLLPKLFPVLQRVEAIARAPREDVGDLDPHARRGQLFEVFRNLIHKVAERAQLVITIDDMQWADHDSKVLLAELTLAPDPPPLLLIATSRPGPALAGIEIDAEIPLEPLRREDARELAATLLRRLGVAGDPDQIAAESRGHPMFVQELVRYASEFDTQAQQVRLEDALLSRVERLAAPARELLRVLCVAAAPIPLDAARLATGLEAAGFQRARATLRAASLARASTAKDERIEPYHDRIRAAVFDALPDERRDSFHERIAIALEQTGAAAADPEIMVQHLRAIRDHRAAADYARRAAERASCALAFEQAAHFYSLALRLGSAGEEERRALSVALAGALASAGRGVAAARAFDDAARGADPATALECHRRAAEQQLISGHIEAGMESIQTLLADVGVTMPRTPRRALASVLWNRFKLRVRGHRWTHRHRQDIADSERVRLEVFRTAAHGLAMVDTIRGTDFQVRGLLLALRVGDPRYVGSSLGLEAAFHALQGGHRRALRLHALASEIAERHADPYLEAFAEATLGIIEYFAGSFLHSTERLDSARERFREMPGALWEINSTRVFGLFGRRFLGDYRRLERDCDAYLRDAELRGDRYLASSVRRVCAPLWLARGEPERVPVELERAEWAPSERAFHVQHFHELIARGELALYVGDGDRALGSLADDYRRLRQSMLTRAQSMRTQARYLWGRLALSSDESSAASCAAGLARKLRRENAPYAWVWSDILRAGVAARRGDTAGARKALERAIAHADDCDMRVYAAAARMRLGELLGGAEGDAQLATATGTLLACGVVDPPTMAAMLVPRVTDR